MKAAEKARRITAAQRRIARCATRVALAAEALREAERWLWAEKTGRDLMRQIPVTDEVADAGPDGPL